MLKQILPFAFALVWFGCESNSAVDERQMTVAPLSLTFNSGDTVQTISITHNCTCPFGWYGNPASNADSVLKSFSGVGDNGSVQVFIDRTKLPKDSASITQQWRVTSNGYGTQTIGVTIIR